MIYATDENYKELVSEGIVIADFFGKTCVPCRMIAPVLEELEDEFPFIKIVKVDIDDCPGIADEFNIDGIPDLYYYKDGAVVFHETGAVTKEEIKVYLSKILYE